MMAYDLIRQELLQKIDCHQWGALVMIAIGIARRLG